MSDDGADKTSSLVFNNPVYLCPVHGKVAHTLRVGSLRVDLDGDYCMVCILERMVSEGIPKVSRVD